MQGLRIGLIVLLLFGLLSSGLIWLGYSNGKHERENQTLLEAVQRNDLDAVKTALTRGASVEARDKFFGGTALIAAADQGHVEIVNLLLAHGANVNATFLKGRDTALTQAADNGHTEVVQALLAHGAAINTANDFGMTALMNAVRKGHLSTVQLLLKQGASVRGRDKGGAGILQWAGRESSYYNNLSRLRPTEAGKRDAIRRYQDCQQIIVLLKQAEAKE